jgi:hypothetical protein
MLGTALTILAGIIRVAGGQIVEQWADTTRIA